MNRILTLIVLLGIFTQCASVPETVQTSTEGDSLVLSIASVEDEGQSLRKGNYEYSTTDPSIRYINYTVVVENKTASPVAISVMSFVASPVLEASMDGEKAKLAPISKHQLACCGFAGWWFDVAEGTRISFGSGSAAHFREIEPGGKVAISLVFLAPVGQRHKTLKYEMDAKLLKGVKELEEKDLFASPEAPYVLADVEVEIPQ
ncbi:MAG: hypothetical protein CMN77_01930 [Spirochaetaceae bacterium]|nr:hypothetical protein [Spirochaetaceae bacterium]|tara:strand:+ start:25397 stop:26008 length:612 start_codon:yes stop_codon:yes gene_type:complete